MKARRFVAAIDFDGTVHDVTAREPGYKMGKPYPGAKECLDRLRELGAEIVIHTCRGRAALGLPDLTVEFQQKNGTLDHVRQWLDFFDIPFDEITAVKPIADVYVDDRAIPFDGDWARTERDILAMFYLGTRP